MKNTLSLTKISLQAEKLVRKKLSNQTIQLMIQQNQKTKLSWISGMNLFVKREIKPKMLKS